MPSVKEAGLFLSEYASWMLGSGATCIRIEKNVSRMAAAFGMDVEISILPRHIHIAVRERLGDSCHIAVAAVKHVPVSYDIITGLSRLSWEVADGEKDFASARRDFEKTVAAGSMNPLLLLLLVCLANASFCRLFGGDVVAMIIVAVATLAGFRLKCILTQRKIDIRITVFLCALVSSVLGSTDLLFSMGTTPAVALGTSVLYLVPGIPFLNSFSDLVCRYYICAFSRFTDAVITTACLSAGLCTGMMLMNNGMF